MRIALLTASLAAASFLWDHWKHRRPLRVNSQVLICFALLLWAVMLLPISLWPGGSAATLTNLYIKAVVVFWVLANVITSERRLQTIATLLTFCTLPLAITAIDNFASGNFVNQEEVVARIEGYESGLARNPNDLALMLNLLLPISIARVLGDTTKLARAVYVFMIVASVGAIIVTFSRAGFLGLIAIATMCVLKMMRRRGADRMWAVAVVAAAFLTVPLLPSTYVDRIATVTSVNADPTGSSQVRWRDTLAAVQYVVQHPILGAGLGMNALALNQVRGEDWFAVHNVYLQYAVDLGLPGLALFLALFYGLYKAVRRCRAQLDKDRSRRNLFLLVEALEISLVVFAVSGFFYPVAYHFYFYYIGGLALAATRLTHLSLAAQS